MNAFYQPGATIIHDRLANPMPARSFPDHRHLYLLVAGIVLGMLLSGAVLGRVAPSWYDALFVGSGPAAAELRQLEAEQRMALRILTEQTGVSPVAIHEQMARHEQEAVQLRAQLEQARFLHAQRLAGRLTALILAIIAVMVLEALISPAPVPPDASTSTAPALRPLGRLVTVRYALIALWIALAIAQPPVLRAVPLLFTGLLIAVALFAAFVPLGLKRSGAGETPRP